MQLRANFGGEEEIFQRDFLNIKISGEGERRRNSERGDRGGRKKI